jgi:hypothetical protein
VQSLVSLTVLRPRRRAHYLIVPNVDPDTEKHGR